MDLQGCRPRVLQDVAGACDFLSVPVDDHQMLAGSYMFVIFEDVLLGNSPARQRAQYPAIGRTNYGPLRATQDSQEQRRQSPSHTQRAEPGNPQESCSRAQAQ
jgi:hypothetical protein